MSPVLTVGGTKSGTCTHLRVDGRSHAPCGARLVSTVARATLKHITCRTCYNLPAVQRALHTPTGA